MQDITMVNLKNVVRDIKLLAAELGDLQKEIDKKAYKLDKQLNSPKATFKTARETLTGLESQNTALKVQAEQLEKLIAIVQHEVKGMSD